MLFSTRLGILIFFILLEFLKSFSQILGDMPLLDTIQLCNLVALVLVGFGIAEHTVLPFPETCDDGLEFLFGEFYAEHISNILLPWLR